MTTLGDLNRFVRQPRWPHPGVDALACGGALVALWPCGLPRPAVISGVLTAACVGLATILGSLVTRGRAALPAPSVAALFAAAGGLTFLGVLSVAWQNALRSELGAPRVGIGWWLASVAPAMALFCAIVLVPRASALAALAAAALLAGYLPAAHADGPRSPRLSEPGVLVQSDAVGPDIGARMLATQWVRSGGLERRHVVIAVPTGSGWVDPTAVRDVVDRFDGDVRVLTLRYAHQSSWRAFIGDQAAAGRSATALLREVIGVAEHQPAQHRPAIHLYGQSLGAIGADEARAWAATHRPGTVADTLLAGAPADTVGSVAPGERRTVVANRSDPVTRWSVPLLWRPAHTPADAVRTGRRAPRPPWLPVIGFLQTSVDLLSSLDGPPGVGHRYGGYPMGPRAAS